MENKNINNDATELTNEQQAAIEENIRKVLETRTKIRAFWKKVKTPVLLITGTIVGGLIVRQASGSCPFEGDDETMNFEFQDVEFDDEDEN